jgi:hypothetical protein
MGPEGAEGHLFEGFQVAHRKQTPVDAFTHLPGPAGTNAHLAKFGMVDGQVAPQVTHSMADRAIWITGMA